MSSSISNLCERYKDLTSKRLFSNEQSLILGFCSGNKSRKNLNKQNLVLMYVIQGNGSFQVDGKDPQFLKPGSLLIRKPGTRHHVTCQFEPDWCEFFIIFPNSFYEFLEINNFLPRLDLCLQIDLDLLWLKHLIDITTKIGNCSPSEDLKVSNMIFKLLEDFKSKLLPKNTIPVYQEDMLGICRWIDKNPAERLSNKEMAEKAGYGLESFRKIFKEVIGCSPQEYLIRQRIREAQRMIWENKLELNNIAFELGYNDLPSFSRQFKKMTGISPSAYGQTSL